MNYKHIFILLFTIITKTNFAQSDIKKKNKAIKDSIYIGETEDRSGIAKVLHAEPLYIDLIRDLGARKGEKEWNVAFGLADNNNADKYTALVEYEFAPIDRLGFEVELPFTFYFPSKNNTNTLGSKLNSLKLATQYTFLVAEKTKTSLAIGYIHEFEFPEFRNYRKEFFFKGNIYNPFFIAAKRWGNNFHTLLYTGPAIEHVLKTKRIRTIWQINSNFHYMIKGTRNFIGIELNKEVSKNNFDMTIRPQMRLAITEHLLIGILTGIPISKKNERFSTFVRLIYEPKEKQKRH